jgi:hypothetical protein
MRADLAQALVARYLVDPDFFDRCENVNGSLESSGLGDFPLQHMRSFRAFITRIKHTQLRKTVPCTLRLLGLFRIDLDLFETVSSEFQRAKSRGPSTLPDLLQRFEIRLRQKLLELPENIAVPMEAILRHEMTVWRAAQAEPGRPSLQPRLRSDVSIESYACDVSRLYDSLKRDRFVLPETVSGEFFLIYRRVSEEVEISNSDPFSAYVLSRLDGFCSLVDIGAHATTEIGEEAGDAVREVARQAIDLGFVMRGRTEAPALQPPS